MSLVNEGTAPVDLGPPSVTGDQDLSVRADTCGDRLDPATSCTVDVSFAPRRAGEHSASLVVPVASALGRRQVRLVGSATGMPLGRAPEVSAVLGRALLRWPGGSDGGSPITAFRVQRATGSGTFTTLTALAPDVVSWVDPAVVPGQTYRYRVLADNAYGASVPADEHVTSVVVPREELVVAISDEARTRLDLAQTPVRGGLPVRITKGEDTDLPTVSPDGRHVAYVVLDATGDAGLWVRPAAGSAPARLLVDAPGVDETDPAWSPDGSKICYSRLTGTADVWCIPVAGGSAAGLFPNATAAMEPSWLPDGSGLVVTDVSNGSPRLARITASGLRTVLPGTDGGSWPAASPRGDRIAFVLTDADEVDHLRTVGPAGGTPVELSTTRWELYDRPSWAPDGQTLAVPTSGPWGAALLTVWRAPQGATPASVESVRAAAGYGVGAVAWRRQDVAPPTITFPAAPSLTTGAVRLPVRVVDDTVPVGGLTVRCTVDGKPVSRCASGWSGSLPAGAHRLVVTATDPHGHTTTAAHAWTVDTTAPAVSLAALPTFTMTATTAVSYAATDASGVAHYDVRYRRAAWSGAGFTAATVPAGWAATTARSQTLALAPGSEYCFSVRARDRAGNLAPWSAERCTAVPLDDRSLGRATGGWTSVAAPSAFAGTVTRTSSAGTRLVRPSVQARRLAVVATTCPTCGSVEVLLGTTRVGRISLTSPTTRPRQVLQVSLLTAVRAGTVTLRSTSTSSGRPVDIDGLGLRKT